jgi:uncharacterized RDD family membrane protein YckC
MEAWMSQQPGYTTQYPHATPGYPPGAADKTPVGSGPRAGVGRRFVALLIDSAILSVLVGVIAEAMGYDVFYERTINGIHSYGISFTGGAFLLRIAIEGLYFGILEGRRAGQTLGKAIMSIRVMRLDTGEPLGFGRALGRYLAKYLSALPLLLGFMWAIWDRQKQAWHDKLVDSVVVPVSAYPVTPLPDQFPAAGPPQPS